MLHLNRILRDVRVFSDNLESELLNLFGEIYALAIAFSPYLSDAALKEIEDTREAFLKAMSEGRAEFAFKDVMSMLKLVLSEMKRCGVLMEEAGEWIV